MSKKLTQLEQYKNEILGFYHFFCRQIAVVEQFHDRNIQKALRNVIPREIQKMPRSVAQIEQLARFVYEFMEWDESPALNRQTSIYEILRYRRGRCGEYAILCTGMVAALGYVARLVVDETDHCWTEFSVNNKWIPIDSTLENPVIDRFSREKAGKPISYIFAFHAGMTEDVTFDYVQDKEAVKPRRRLDPFPEILIRTYRDL